MKSRHRGRGESGTGISIRMIKRDATVTKFRTGRSWCIKIIRNSWPSRDLPRYRFRTNNLSKINDFLGCVFTHASFY